MAKKEYIKANTEWLVAKEKEIGVRKLPGGVLYKVIEEGCGDGRHPSPNSVITAHYTGWTIDGKEFDSSRGNIPLAIRLHELIPGWVIAMQGMCVGDRWKIYIPSELGYGKFSQPGIPGGSTLVFDVELLAIL